MIKLLLFLLFILFSPISMGINFIGVDFFRSVSYEQISESPYHHALDDMLADFNAPTYFRPEIARFRRRSQAQMGRPTPGGLLRWISRWCRSANGLGFRGSLSAAAHSIRNIPEHIWDIHAIRAARISTYVDTINRATEAVYRQRLIEVNSVTTASGLPRDLSNVIIEFSGSRDPFHALVWGAWENAWLPDIISLAGVERTREIYNRWSDSWEDRFRQLPADRNWDQAADTILIERERSDDGLPTHYPVFDQNFRLELNRSRPSHTSSYSGSTLVTDAPVLALASYRNIESYPQLGLSPRHASMIDFSCD